jgi:predicted DNA-binding transcriptional regulator YafY
MSKAKLERLLNLTALLIETPRPLAAEEIHARMDGYPESPVAFHQAFERDKRNLREMGIPLVVERVPGTMPAVEGYRIPKDRYYLADPGLEADELAALHLASRAVRLEGQAVQDGLAKLEGLGDAPSGPLPPDSALEGDVETELAWLPGGPDLSDLFGAVTDRRPVEFMYRGEPRTVDPYRLDYQRGRWYLTGFDHVRAQERVFRLDRMEGSIEVLEGPAFTRPTTAVVGGPAEPWQLGEGEPIHARLAVDASQAPWVVDHLGESAVVDQRDDGSVIVELAVTNRGSFRSFVLTFLDHAEVVAPPELRRDVIEWLRRITDEPAPDATTASARQP